MTPAVSPPTADPSDQLVRAALDDPDVLSHLTAHALARLGELLPDRPTATRADLAREAVQEASRRALSRAGTFDPAARVSPAGWVHGILSRVLSELCRDHRKQPCQSPDDPAGWDQLAASLAAPDGPTVLTDLLDRLLPDQRQVITLAYLDGLTHREIADRLGKTPGAARTQLCRALAELRRIASEPGEGDR